MISGHRIVRTVQQLPALVDVFALLDAAPHAANKDIIINQDWEGRIAPELLPQCKRGKLALLERLYGPLHRRANPAGPRKDAVY